MEIKSITNRDEQENLLEQYPFVDVPFGPRGCSDERLTMASSYEPGGFLWRMKIALKDHLNNQRNPEQEADTKRQQLGRAALYWVGRDMCELLREAAQSVPLDSSIPIDLIPFPSGLVFFETAMPGTSAYEDERDRGEMRLNAMHWWPCLVSQPVVDSRIAGDTDPWPQMEIDFYSYRKGIGHIYVGGTGWPLEVPLGRVRDGSTDEARESQIEDRRLFAAFVALLASPGVASTTIQRPDRAASRRSQRAGIELGDTRVIYLRSLGSGEHGDGQSNYHHRWIVSGHWRSQPYGPGRARRKPVWIAPHVKGPEGAPLLHGDKVRAVVR